MKVGAANPDFSYAQKRISLKRIGYRFVLVFKETGGDAGEYFHCFSHVAHGIYKKLLSFLQRHTGLTEFL
jgi:hypothetical protein